MKTTEKCFKIEDWEYTDDDGTVVYVHEWKTIEYRNGKLVTVWHRRDTWDDYGFPAFEEWETVVG